MYFNLKCINSVTAQWWQIVVCFYLIIYQNLKTQKHSAERKEARSSKLLIPRYVQLIRMFPCWFVQVQFIFHWPDYCTRHCTAELQSDSNWSGSTKSLAFFWWNKQAFSWKRRIKLLLVARGAWKWRRNWYYMCVCVCKQTWRGKHRRIGFPFEYLMCLPCMMDWDDSLWTSCDPSSVFRISCQQR